MDNTRLANLLARIILAVSLFAVILSACSQASGPTATPLPEPTQTPSPTAAPGWQSLPDGGLVYADPGGRFTFPLLGDWTPVETDGSYSRFTLADPDLELCVVTAETDELKSGMEVASAEIGIDTSALSLLYAQSSAHWSIFIYSSEDGQGLTVAAQVLDDVTVVFIITAESSVVKASTEEFWAGLDGFAAMPLADYLGFQPPPAPTTVEDIEDLDAIEFYSGKTKLVGRLILPDGEEPFPAVVHLGDGSGPTTRKQNIPYIQYELVTAGFAVFSYDKRGAGDSEGVFVPVIVKNGEWRLLQLAADALSAVALVQGLEEINPNQIGLMGDSENGWTIPLVASRSDAVAFTVINSGPTVSMGEELYWSLRSGDVTTLSASEREELSEQLTTFDGPRGFDPRPFIEAMTIPGLWIWGERDGSMPARESKAILESIIEEYDRDFSILYYPDAGHGVSAPTSEVVDWIYAHLEE